MPASLEAHAMLAGRPSTSISLNPMARRSLWCVIDRIRIAPGTQAPHPQARHARPFGLRGQADGIDPAGAPKPRIERLQQRLFAEGRHSVLLVLQGLDAAGQGRRDSGRVRGSQSSGLQGRVVQGCRTAPSSGMTISGGCTPSVPAARRDRDLQPSHYEDVVTVRMLELAPEDVWRRRPAHIVEWERMLTDEGTSIVKVFLNVSKEEQRKRLQERIDNPEKRWKFRKDDLNVRARFDDYIAAYEDVIEETSSEVAPWHVVPADRNWVKATAVAEPCSSRRSSGSTRSCRSPRPGSTAFRSPDRRPDGPSGQRRIARTRFAGQPYCSNSTASTMSALTQSAILRASARGNPHSARASNRARSSSSAEACPSV